MGRARLKDLAQWAAGVSAPSSTDVFFFLDFYALSDEEAFGSELRARVRPYYERVVARKAERIRTRPDREPEGPPRPMALEPGEPPRVRVCGIAALR